MSTKQQKMELREQGMTYKQIAEHLGISYQAVAASLAGYAPCRFHWITESQCIFPGLRNWMNENKTTLPELVRRCGYAPLPTTLSRMRDYLCGRSDMRKKTIDKILCATGLTYEDAFG